MSTKSQQISNSFIYLIPVVVSNILPFITLPIFSRILTTEDYGVFALATAYATFVVGLADLGMSAAYERNYFQYKTNDKKVAQLLYSCLIFVSVNFFWMVVATYLFQLSISNILIGEPEYGTIICLMLLAQFFQLNNGYYLTYFKNSEMAKQFALYTIIDSVINSVIALWFVAYWQIGVIGLVLGLFVAKLSLFLLLTIKFLGILPFHLSWTIFIDSFRLAYPTTPTVLLKPINSQFDKYMIGLLNSVGGVGIYSISEKISQISFTYMTAIQNVFGPQVFNRMFKQGPDKDSSIGQYLTPFFYVSIFVTMGVALFSEEIIWFLTPPEYHQAIDVVAVLCMYKGFLFFGKIAGTQILFARKTFLSAPLKIMTMALNVIVNIPFIIQWGVLGAAWATLLSGITSTIITSVIGQFYYRIDWEYNKITTILVTFFSSTILLIILRDIQIEYSIRFGVKLVSLIIFFAIGYWVNVLTVENAQVIKNIFTNKFRAMTSRSS